MKAGGETWRYFLGGALLGIAVLVRTNLAYVQVASVILVGFTFTLADAREKLTHAGWLVAGTLVPFFLVLAVYAADGHSRLLFDSAIRVPLAYAESGMGLLDTAMAMVRQAVRYHHRIAFDSVHQTLTYGLWKMGAMLFWIGGISGTIWLVVSEYRQQETGCFYGTFLSIRFLFDTC